MASDHPITTRILRELRCGPASGQTELMDRVLGPHRTLDECEGFRLALRYHLTPPIKVVEERIQREGTGHEGPPVFEFRYRLATMAETIASHRTEVDADLAEDGPQIEESSSRHSRWCP